MRLIRDIEDTIVALSTPIGGAGRAIVRASGNACVPLVADIFRANDGCGHADWQTHSRIEGMLTVGGCEVPCALYVMRAPKSYTRQDVLELHLPGSPALAEMALEALVAGGARRAEAGEFTLRAFLNGRLDLAQAEAVEAMIASASERERRAALERMDGVLSSKIKEWRTTMIDTIAQVEGELDFEEDEFAPLPAEELSGRVRDVTAGLEILLKDCGVRNFQHGAIPVLFAGLTNAGKSSIVNALLGRDEAVVSHERSTTRDRLDFELVMEPFHFILQDSPGLDLSGGEFARIASGVAEKSGKTAGVIVLVVDGSEVLHDDIRILLKKIPAVPVVPLINKSDLAQAFDEAAFMDYIYNARPDLCDGLLLGKCVTLSAENGVGLEGLREALAGIATRDLEQTPEGGTLNFRMAEELGLASGCLSRAAELFDSGVSYEFAAEELRTAYASLGHIVGEGYAEEVLESIFSRFCIGK